MLGAWGTFLNKNKTSPGANSLKTGQTLTKQSHMFWAVGTAISATQERTGVLWEALVGEFDLIVREVWEGPS